MNKIFKIIKLLFGKSDTIKFPIIQIGNNAVYYHEEMYDTPEEAIKAAEK